MADNIQNVETGENKENIDAAANQETKDNAEKIENMSKVEEKEEMITLESSEGQKYYVARSLVVKSTLIKDLLTHCDMTGDDNVIPLLNVKTWCLEKIVEWMNNHRVELTMDEKQQKDYKCVDEFDRKFFGEMTPQQHCDIIAAANYMAIKRLLDNGCKLIANDWIGKKIEAIREKWGIKNDYTKEQEELIILENKWIED